MITTGCKGCCFSMTDNSRVGCAAQQLCVIKDNVPVAPGYCRQCRSYLWAKKQNTADIAELLKKVTEENKLQFDLLVVFDESIHSSKNLKRTLDTAWHQDYVKRIIIVDTTGFGGRQNITMKYLNNNNSTIPMLVDSSVENESVSDMDQTIRRLSRQVKAPFFMVVPAGNILQGIDVLAATVQHIPSRVVKWSLPRMVGKTIIVPNYYGLYITKPYRAIMRSNPDESFVQNLNNEEKETGMGLSWLCSECILT